MTAQIDLGQHVKSGFDYSYPFDSTGRIGRINCTRCMSVLPADSIKGQSFAQVQFEPLAVPILNNMHVKQEHFYVTKNSVWENFDDFISGGEDMDYDGKVPSMSLREMWTFWYGRLSMEFDLPLIYIPFSYIQQGTWNSATEKITIAISESAIKDTFLNYEMTSGLRADLESMQMLDLFSHLVPLHKAAGEYMLSQINAGINVFEYNSEKYLILFKRGYFSTDELGSDDTIEQLWSSANPNKYIREIYKSIVADLDNLQTSSLGGRLSLIPTSSFLSLLEYSYQIIRPFFGTTSYLDQMSYNKIRYVDWLYLYCIAIGRIVASAGDKDLNVEPYVQYMSDEPEEILSLRAQYCVWWNNYRDQLLETKAPRPQKGDDITPLEIFCLLAPRVRCWHKDTFTTALDSAGTVNGIVPTQVASHQTATIKSHVIDGLASDEVARTDKSVYEITIDNNTFRIPTGFISGMHNVDSEVESSTSNYFSLDLLDAAKRAQKWLRKSVFYGNRIQDFLWTRFGVKYLDARLRLPELLSTSSTLVRIDAVVNNTTVVTDQSSAIAGDRSAIAWSQDKEPGYFSRYCEEHGFIISNLTIMPDVAYMNTYNKCHSELDQFDYPFEDFATLGLDAVYDVELSQLPVKVFDSVTEGFASSPKVFGYQGRYYNYKAHHGEVHGELLDTQDAYLFGRKFNIYDPDSRPKLNYIFVHCHPFLGMFVVDNEWSDYFRYNLLHAYDADRLLPVHSMYL